MPRDIAVLLDSKGHTVSLDQPGTLWIYSKRQRVWQGVKSMEYALDKSLGLNGLRKQMEVIVNFLGDCRIVVGSAFSGVPYYELEKAGCSVWEFSGEPSGFLDYVNDQEETVATEKCEEVTGTVIPLPEDLGAGQFRISIKETQKGGGATSKQVLMPVLRQRKFYSLEVLCGHVPPWLEGELANGPWEYDIVKDSIEELRVIIRKKTCSSMG